MTTREKAARQEETEQEETEGTTLSNLAPNPGARRRRKRLGIGEGSGNGKTCGKGQKGQRMRSGFSLPPGFEGGQMPIHRRLPKVGFTSRKKTLGVNTFSTIALAKVAELDMDEVTVEKLREKGLLRSRATRVKILGGSSISKKISVQVHAVTASARAAIEGAGGKVLLIED